MKPKVYTSIDMNEARSPLVRMVHADEWDLLMNELRHLRGERAAVVAWLREAGHSGALDVEVTGVPVSERERAILRRVVTMALCEAANLVDSGEHRREEER